MPRASRFCIAQCKSSHLTRHSNVNIGWSSKGMGDAEYLDAFNRVVMPIASEFNPDLVIGGWVY